MCPVSNLLMSSMSLQYSYPVFFSGMAKQYAQRLKGYDKGTQEHFGHR